jgi:hypothetical protein
MYMYLYIVVYVGHEQRGRPEDYLSALVLYGLLGESNEIKDNLTCTEISSF